MRESINSPAADFSRTIVKREPAPGRVLFRMGGQLVKGTYTTFKFVGPFLTSLGLTIAGTVTNAPLMFGGAFISAYFFLLTGMLAGLNYADKNEGYETPAKAWLSIAGFPFKRLGKWYQDTAKSLEG